MSEVWSYLTFILNVMCESVCVYVETGAGLRDRQIDGGNSNDRVSRSGRQRQQYREREGGGGVDCKKKETGA